MLRAAYILIFALLLACPCDATAQKHTAKSIKRQQQENKKEIKETNRKIKDNTKETKRSLNRLNLIEAQISEQQKTIEDISNELDSINRKLSTLQDSINAAEKEISRLKDNYSCAIRNIRAQSSSLDRMLFIFSAGSFNQAYRRMRYLQQFSEWRKKQTEKIAQVQSQMQARYSTIASYKKQRSTALAKQNSEKLSLMKKRKEQAVEVNTLKKEGKTLQKILSKKQRRANELDEALNKLIAEEERKAALRAKQEEEKRIAEQKKKGTGKQTDSKKGSSPRKGDKTDSKSAKPATGYNMSETERALSGSFESNKGNLLFPVSGKYSIVRPFGRQRHPELKYVQTDNGGIDIEVSAGTKARAVFDGKVTAVFRQDDFNTIVMVRHGNYLTIYVNLSEIYVSNGDMVKANQPIGKIFSDPDDDNRTILHFEVRHEREKLNPQEWVR